MSYRRSSVSTSVSAVPATDASGTWVKVKNPPTPYSFDEALLLCEQDEGRWVVWIPDFGEMILIEGQFYGDLSASR
jgi:hypothetical protein